MDEEWDADSFEPKEIKPVAVVANKWEGEDEEEDVKDNWEDEEEEEKKDIEKQETTTRPLESKKPKKSLQQKIEEREQKLKEEAEKKAKVKETLKDLSPEEMLAEKLRQQKLQEEADLRVAMETFGVAESSSTGIDGMNPNTKEEFDELQAAITKKIQYYTKSPHFPVFAEDLIRNICVNLGSQDLKKLKTTVENMFLEKTKVEKGDKAKKNKGKGKVKLRVEGENALVNEYSAYGDYDDFDDFM